MITQTDRFPNFGRDGLPGPKWNWTYFFFSYMFVKNFGMQHLMEDGKIWRTYSQSLWMNFTDRYTLYTYAAYVRMNAFTASINYTKLWHHFLKLTDDPPFWRLMQIRAIDWYLYLENLHFQLFLYPYFFLNCWET